MELRFDVARAPFAEDLKVRLRALAGKRMTADDVLVIEAREHRTQAQNREAARARLDGLLADARRRPRSRRATKPTAAARERRIQEKKQRARVKQSRRSTDDS